MIVSSIGSVSSAAPLDKPAASQAAAPPPPPPPKARDNDGDGDDKGAAAAKPVSNSFAAGLTELKLGG